MQESGTNAEGERESAQASRAGAGSKAGGLTEPAGTLRRQAMFTAAAALADRRTGTEEGGKGAQGVHSARGGRRRTRLRLQQ